MKAIVLITDADAMGTFERALMETGDRGFTIVPSVLGRGKTGLKAGDRVHPGGSSLLFTVVSSPETGAALDFLKGVRDAAGLRAQTKIYVAPVDEIID